MPRNGSGNYSVPLTFTAHTDADAADMNQNFNDVGAALTASLAADGQTIITGQLKGLVNANPCWSFAGDLDTGFGSDVANEAFIRCGGAEIARATSAGLNVTLLKQGGSKLVPTGACFDYIGATAPGGYVLGNGGSIGSATSGATERANADTQELFELIWNSANVASGEGQVQDSTGANVARGANATADFVANRRILLPDFRDRVVRGKSGSTNLGDTGGADTVTIAQANLPNYALPNTLAVSLTNGTQVVRSPSTTFSAATGGVIDVPRDATRDTVSASITGSVTSGGSGTSLDVKPKFVVKTKIIRL